MPKTKVEKIEASILIMLRAAKKQAGKGQIPINDPDYAEAYGLHRGFLVGIYGAYSQALRIGLPDGRVVTAQEWFRSLRDRVEAEAGA
jgi:hypothetical protein